MISPTQFVEALLDAARKEDWETVDNELVPQISKFDGNELAIELLGHVDDENSNIRDMVATSFAGLKDLDFETKGKVAESMFKMVQEDNERYPAGRAMAYLLTLKDKPKFQKHVDEVSVEFRQRSQELNWAEDLKENIPALKEIL